MPEGVVLRGTQSVCGKWGPPLHFGWIGSVLFARPPAHRWRGLAESGVDPLRSGCPTRITKDASVPILRNIGAVQNLKITA